jgi:hypothetical protein
MCAVIAASSTPVCSPKSATSQNFLPSLTEQNIYLGVHPAKGYDALLEFGGCKQTPILLKEPQVQTLAIHFPVLCVEMRNDRQYSSGSKKSEFTLSTTKQYRTARLKHGDKYIVYRLHDLQNLLRILYLTHKQQKFFLRPYQTSWIMPILR